MDPQFCLRHTAKAKKDPHSNNGAENSIMIIKSIKQLLILRQTDYTAKMQMDSSIEKNTILFTLVYESESFPVQTRPGRYHSLMSLISDYLTVPGFGLCSGMGSCGTCMVNIDGESTLSCAVDVNDALANTTIAVELPYY